MQDKRDVVFEDRRTALLFPGTGQSLIDDEDHAKNHKVESQPPGLCHSLDNTNFANYCFEFPQEY